MAPGDGGASVDLADGITDFQDGTDLIRLGGGLTFADLTIDTGSDVVVDATNDTVISVTAAGGVVVDRVTGLTVSYHRSLSMTDVRSIGTQPFAA